MTTIDPIRFAAAGASSREIAGLEDRQVLPSPGEARPGAASFGEALEAALESVSRVQAQSDEATRQFALGKETDLHTVLIQVEKADLAFRTMMEVRNKLLEAYREVMRMQI